MRSNPGPAAAIVAALAVAQVMAGCAQEPAGGQGAATPQEQICIDLIHDMRLYCNQGLRDNKASTGIDCVSRRLEFERRCMPRPQ